MSISTPRCNVLKPDISQPVRTNSSFFFILKRLAVTIEGFVLFVTGKPPDVAKWRVKAIVSTLLLY